MYYSSQKNKKKLPVSLLALIMLVWILILPITSICSTVVKSGGQQTLTHAYFDGYGFLLQFFNESANFSFNVYEIPTLKLITMFSLALAFLFFLIAIFSHEISSKYTLMNVGFVLFLIANICYMSVCLQVFSSLFIDLKADDVAFNIFLDSIIFFCISLLLMIVYVILRIGKNR